MMTPTDLSKLEKQLNMALVRCSMYKNMPDRLQQAQAELNELQQEYDAAKKELGDTTR